MELFLVNYIPYQQEQWKCFCVTASRERATMLLSEFFESGQEAKIQSVFLTEKGEITL